LKIVRTALLACAMTAVGALSVRAQNFGIGGAAGIVNDVSTGATFSDFQWGEANGWFEYKMEPNTVLRLMYGSMWTQQSRSGAVVTTPDGTLTLPELDENVNYGIVSVSYLFWEGFFTSGLFAGIGGYGIRPDPVPPEAEPYADEDETVFGWHAGVDGEFQVHKQLGLVLRFTYHNVSAHPHRQFLNADAGVVFRF
jgi:Outer membrane protein beta-barrel domain